MNPEPQKKAQLAIEILAGLPPVSHLDEFTLKRLENEFTLLVNSERATNTDIRVLATIYYHQKKYKKFITYLEEKIKYTKDFKLFSLYTLGKILLEPETKSKIEVVNKWFDDPINEEKYSFTYFTSTNSFKPKVYIGKGIINLTKSFSLEIDIVSKEKAIIKTGPLEFEVTVFELFHEMELQNMDNIVVDYYIDCLLNQSNSTSDDNYIQLHMKEQDFKKVHEYSESTKVDKHKDYSQYEAIVI
ncbi:MAG: hypothetical protein ABUK01_10965 [Leptospirales bacterium]